MSSQMEPDVWFITLNNQLDSQVSDSEDVGSNSDQIGAVFTVDASGDNHYESWSCQLSLEELHQFWVEMRNFGVVNKLPLPHWPTIPEVTGKSFNSFFGKKRFEANEKQKKQIEDFFLGISRSPVLNSSSPIRKNFSEAAEKEREKKRRQKETRDRLIGSQSDLHESLKGLDESGNEVDLYLLPKVPQATFPIPTVIYLGSQRINEVLMLQPIYEHITECITRFLAVHDLASSPQATEEQLMSILESQRERLLRDSDTLEAERISLHKAMRECEEVKKEGTLRRFIAECIVEVERAVRWERNLDSIVFMKLEQIHMTSPLMGREGMKHANLSDLYRQYETKSNELMIALGSTDMAEMQKASSSMRDLILQIERDVNVLHEKKNTLSTLDTRIVESLDRLLGTLKKNGVSVLKLIEGKLFQCIDGSAGMCEGTEQSAKKDILRQVKTMRRQLRDIRSQSTEADMDEAAQKHVMHQIEDIEENVENFRHNFCNQFGMRDSTIEREKEESSRRHEKYQEDMFQL
ncbi:hypothetical protein PROFUN_15168 [Planoprotostelium fungivorum]|uniref:PX domain-containing protein n=1 Tax=Planoprotostelium fungivorum TaxID=1890364 RepID=A0A2P6MTZ4_9EUKA|nr:hypothetical protein PROFUN_15168 [Planoprotostelium fungivorum]